MNKRIIFLLVLALTLSGNTCAQIIEDFYDEYIKMEMDDNVGLSTTLFSSERGYAFPTKGTYRMLVIFVNVIYDVNPDLDPHVVNNWGWSVKNEEGINKLPPTEYFNDIFDVNNGLPRQGSFTRFMSECSFDSLVILGDFTSVEIKESRIREHGTKHRKLMEAVVNYINEQGGLNAIYGHNSIEDYDNATCGSNKYVSSSPNGKLDYVSFFVLNPCDELAGFPPGSGYTGSSLNVKLKLSGNEYPIECWQASGIGHMHLKYEQNIFVHEFAHSLLGGNEFHTSGGNHLGSNEIATFLFSQSGYGLFSSSLKSCNAYERWRLGWQSPDNHPYKIAANGVSGEIDEKFSGTRTFYLRDFVTYGDAIRIKLPYKDSVSSSCQYIWLENHQLGRNGKMDGFGYHYFPGVDCIPLGTPGIYAYYQVGKDVLEHTDYSRVFVNNEKDNLRMINAEGNYNMEYVEHNEDCINWGKRPTFRYLSENPISGSNDQTEAINTQNETLDFFSDFYKGVGNKIKNGRLYNQLIYLGDIYDSFISGSVMDISSNPTPVNAITHYAIYSKSNGYEKCDNERDTRKKYLTGLSIKMNHAYYIGETSVFRVDVSWDDYDVKKDVHWAGDIIMKERVNLLESRTIFLEQSLTPNQITRDPVSGVYSPPTKFTCEKGSNMNLSQNSKLILKDKSSLVLDSGAVLQMEYGSKIVVEEGSTLIIKSGASVSINGTGRIIIEKGGFICVEEDADIVLNDYPSIIFLEDGCFIGANPELFDITSCADTIAYMGLGSIVNGGEDIYIQNETITTDRYIGGRNIYVGSDVISSMPQGDVIIKDGVHVIFEPTEQVIFKSGFECEQEGTFEVSDRLMDKNN